jgi:3-oxoacyl-[acyl-carrier protein] reductase
MCFTKSLALQNASYGINANAIAPGPVATHMTEMWGEELNREFTEKIPLKKYGTPKDVAQVALFLASDRAQYLTGEIIDVNGGLLMD